MLSVRSARYRAKSVRYRARFRRMFNETGYRIGFAKSYLCGTVLRMVTSVFDRLLDLAVDQHGYVRVQDAVARGIDGTNLRKLARGGRLERVAQGLYRVPVLPRELHSQYAEAVLWAGGRGVISHSSALALHELCDVNPSQLHVTVPPTYTPRRAGGELYRIWRRTLPESEVTRVDNIPVVTPGRAIADAIALGEDPAMVAQGIKTALRRGDLTAAGAARLRCVQAKQLQQPR